MIQPTDFIKALEILNISFVTGVPDSLLKHVCACITAQFLPEKHVIATNEGSAIGLAIGHYLATSQPALVYMQNSGLGNTINPITSLADPAVYGIPLILMIGWRGEILENGNQLKDEPQHVKQGQITLQQLNVLDIPYRVVDKNSTHIEPILRAIAEMAISRSGPAAIIVRKNTFAPYKVEQSDIGDNPLNRETVIKAVIDALPDDVPIVSTTGKASRELFELRQASNTGHHRDFLTVGGMGHASQIATGIALTDSARKVVCLDGDGASLMHMGGLAISAKCSNLVHIMINNGAHDSVGGQPTEATNLNLAEIASACGYGLVFQAKTIAEINENIQSMIKSNSSSFLEIKCTLGARPDLGRPTRTPIQNKTDFMDFIQESAHE